MIATSTPFQYPSKTEARAEALNNIGQERAEDDELIDLKDYFLSLLYCLEWTYDSGTLKKIGKIPIAYSIAGRESLSILFRHKHIK